MYSIQIRFPFSNAQDENYVLTLYASGSGVFTGATDAMGADTRCFKYISTESVGGNIVTTYEGTLTGDVTSEDDERDDIFVPLVGSKLRFNMACQVFPTWLMDLCDYYTNVRVLLYAIDGSTPKERWRGYLMSNTLNMTVVDELLSCPLVAVDEIGMSKYLKFKENYHSDNAAPSIRGILATYLYFHYSTNFADIYSLIGLTAPTSCILSRDLRIYNAGNTEVTDILNTLHINVERYLLDRDATWSDVLGDVCEYLGVSLYLGNITGGGNDLYVMSDTNYGYSKHMNYTLGSTSATLVDSRAFEDFGNQRKVGADLQVTFKPDEWKGVKVTSKPERPPVHEYLGKDNVKAIAPATGHGQWCETRVGKKRDSMAATTIDNYQYRVFQYADLVDKEDQWVPENKYVAMGNCETASDARYVGVGDGYFPLTDSALGRLRPGPEDTDSMDFALSKWGMIVAKIGTYETLRQKISANLRNYFVILNNKWGRLYWDSDSIPTSYDPDPKVIATFTPFADARSILPDNQSYLSIDFSAIFLTENIGGDVEIVENAAIVSNLKGKIQAVFPITESTYNWEAGDTRYTGDLTSSDNNVVSSYYPYIVARLSIGDHYWNGASWEYHADSSGIPTFNLPLVPDSVEKYWAVSNGYLHKSVKNYYYVACRPRMGASENVFRIPLDGISVSGQPLQGKVRLELFGRIPFFNGYKVPPQVDVHYNNILFVLLDDIKVEFTDDAYYSGEDIETVSKIETDPDSTTKKIREVELSLTTPKVDGVFSNCMIYDDGSSWVNLRHAHVSGGTESTPEEIKAKEMAAVLCGKQEFVELSRLFSGTDTGIYNLGFTVRDLTEANGVFMPIKRKFDWTMGVVRWKMQKMPMNAGDISKYVQDGLVLHLDGKLQGDVAGHWLSLVGGYDYRSYGSPTFHNECVEFDGVDDYFRNDSFLMPETDVGTIEVVFVDTNSNNSALIMSRGDTARLCMYIQTNNRIRWSTLTGKNNYSVPSNTIVSVTVNADRCLVNGSTPYHSGTYAAATTAAAASRIGCRYASGANGDFFKGKIYSIRVYNRKLTEAEMRNNLAVDVARFGIGG